MEFNSRIEALTKAGWEAEVWPDEPEHEVFESLVHELAHNLILGDMTPKDMSETGKLIRGCTPGAKGDKDEILTTAVTIQVCETFYRTTRCSDTALISVAGNIQYDPNLRKHAQEAVIKLLNTPNVLQLSKELYTYIESLVA